MVEADFSGNFVNADNTKENDIIEIIGEGEYEEKESREGTRYRSLNLPVRVNGGRELIFTPSMDCGKRLVIAWGKETMNWIGMKGKAKIYNYKSYGITKQGVEIEPLEAKP